MSHDEPDCGFFVTGHVTDKGVGHRTDEVPDNCCNLGNGTGHPRGVGKLTRTLTREDRVLYLTG